MIIRQGTKLRLDFGREAVAYGRHDGPDELAADTIDLINQLCTQVGMLREDSAPLALYRSGSGPELKSRLLQVQASVTSMASLIAAAGALANV